MTAYSDGHERFWQRPRGEGPLGAGNKGAPICVPLAEHRWHFQQGPIDLIIDVDADDEAREHSLSVCWDNFQQVLPALVGELPLLRRPAVERSVLWGPVARRMMNACGPFADERFITPMAAVAGAVADELIGAFKRSGVRRASINNGGDIALHLGSQASYRVGIWSQLERLGHADRGADLDGFFVVDRSMPVRGVATSGWRGRSFSLGIADSVTILAHNAAAADAAATLVANAVNCNFDGIVRSSAEQLKDDTDLGNLLVTVDVPRLPTTAIAEALSRGRTEAQYWRDRGLIYAAAMYLQGMVEIVLPVAGLADPARRLIEAAVT